MRTSRARELRVNSTKAERRMWRLLHSFRSNGYHFRKQAPIGPYYADIACHHARLVIELDGISHDSRAAARHDAIRDAYLRRQGYTVLRFADQDVLKNAEGVLAMVSVALADRPANLRARRVAGFET